jgi:pyridoxal phosphate enzyme (YggS family)
MRKNEIAKKLTALKKDLKKTQLVAVTKYSPVEDIIMAYEAHHYDFGENRVSDLALKATAFLNANLLKVHWHFIGHLQSNKISALFKIPNLYAIHSVDSLHLLEEMIKHESDLLASEVKIFFQINTSHEVEKSGFESKEDLNQAVELIVKRPSSKLKFYGLMTMGTIRTDNFEDDALRCFKDLAAIAQQLEASFGLKNKLKLSMGMSQDYKIALTCGSDFVRVGSAIFKSIY